MIELNNLKWGDTRINNQNAILELKNEVLLQNPGLTKAELVKIICKDDKYKSNTVYRALRGGDTNLFTIQEEGNTLQMNKNVSPEIKTTFERIKEEIESLLTFNQIITKERIADNVGVSSMTIQRNWKRFKAIIEKHNLAVEQIDKALLKGPNQIKNSNTQESIMALDLIKEKNKIIKINSGRLNKLTVNPVNQKGNKNNFNGILTGKQAS